MCFADSGATSILYLHSKCHSDAPTWAFIDQTEDTITVECSVCRSTVIVLPLAGYPPNLDCDESDFGFVPR